MTKPVMLTVSGTILPDIEQQIEDGRRPRADYLVLADRLQADIVDYSKARAITGRLGKMIERVGGADAMLAYACWKLRSQYKAIFTDGEQVGIPLACLLRLSPKKRARHVMIVHILSVRKKMFFFDWLGIQSCIDRFLVYSTWQEKFIKERWSVEDHRVIWIPFMVDSAFFSPDQVEPHEKTRPQICAVGLERRDYPTLLKAVEGLEIDTVIAAASPWSKYKDTTSGRSIPQNVTVRKFTQFELRQLYADSRFLVMPLEPVDFQAGVTAILEAMAMRKAVICSRVPGQTDVIIHGKNGRYVEPGNAEPLRQEIMRLLEQPDEAERLGMAGRDLIESEMSLEHYADRLAVILRSTTEDIEAIETERRPARAQ